MKTFIIGGTGLLGSAAANELLQRGHAVRSVALPPLPSEANLPPEMELTLGNYLTMSDDELLNQLRGCDSLVFAAGVDERIEFPKPVFDQYLKYNVAPVERLLRLGKQVGVKRAVIMGSYFSYFAKIHPEMRLAEHHPYIRARLLQAETALAFDGAEMAVMVLELPYIFGTQPGRKPVWSFLVERIQGMKGATFYPRGGTTMVTVRQVAQAVAGALEKGRGGTCYPVGWYNWIWTEMLAVFHRSMGLPNRKVVTIPTWLFRLYGRKLRRDFEAKGIETGLDMVHLADLQTAEIFIDPACIRDELGVTDDDLEAAIADSVQLCLQGQSLLDMKAE
jgi:nucleoside-diphosphate-sugar epimerase